MISFAKTKCKKKGKDESQGKFFPPPSRTEMVAEMKQKGTKLLPGTKSKRWKVYTVGRIGTALSLSVCLSFEKREPFKTPFVI